jgi:hypothetical protein
MRAVKAIYEKGKIKLAEKPEEKGPVEVLVVFPESDPWESILNENPPRESFLKYVEECKEQIRQGKAKPLNLDDL